MVSRKNWAVTLVASLSLSIVLFQNCSPAGSRTESVSLPPQKLPGELQPNELEEVHPQGGGVSPLAASVRLSSETPGKTMEVSAKPLIVNSPSSLFGGFALYQRNSPKYLKIGATYFAGLNVGKVISIFKREGETGKWFLFKTFASDFHRPPTLLVLKNHLHVVYETSEGLIKHFWSKDPHLPHSNFLNVNTSAWANRNYYHGAAVNLIDGAIYLCAAVSPVVQSSSFLKCGVYSSGAWTVKAISSYNGHAYVYPNIHAAPNGSGAWVDVGAAPYPTTSAVSAATRALNVVFRLTKSLTMSASIAYSVKLKNAFFTNDFTQTPDGDLALFVSLAYQPGKTTTVGNSSVRALLLSEQMSKENFISSFALPGEPSEDLKGACYSSMTIGDRIFIVGCGRIASSTKGKTWTLSDYEIPSFPSNQYSYGVAQALQNRAGSTDISKISFLQELRNRVSGTISVVEVRLTATD